MNRLFIRKGMLSARQAGLRTDSSHAFQNWLISRVLLKKRTRLNKKTMSLTALSVSKFEEKVKFIFTAVYFQKNSFLLSS